MRRTPAPWRCSRRCVITSRAGSAPHSIVVNPHKWLFTPFDCSLLLTRRIDVLRDALSLVPEYLRTTGGREAGRDYSEYIPQLGRRARGIKMWMLLRYFGLDGLRARLRNHLALAHELARPSRPRQMRSSWRPYPFGLVCFRWRPARLAGREADPRIAAALDQLNEQLLDRVMPTVECSSRTRASTGVSRCASPSATSAPRHAMWTRHG